MFCEFIKKELSTVLEKGSTFELMGKDAHHLRDVLRVSESDKVKLLDGEGRIFSSRVTQITKKAIRLEIVKLEIFERPSAGHVFIGTPKKPAQELILKSATQIGANHIHFIKTEFSQPLGLKPERIRSLFEAGIKQSESPFFPKVTYHDSLAIEVMKGLETLFLFDCASRADNPRLPSENWGLLIGPEGGFSDLDKNEFENLKNIQHIKLNTPILKTETAVTFGMGYLNGLSFSGKGR